MSNSEELLDSELVLSVCLYLSADRTTLKESQSSQVQTLCGLVSTYLGTASVFLRGT